MQVIAETHIAALAARVASQAALPGNDSGAPTAVARANAQTMPALSTLTTATAYRLIVKTAAHWILQSVSVRALPNAPDATLLAARQPSPLPLRALVHALKEVFVQPEQRTLLDNAFSRLRTELPIIAERISLAHSLPPENSLVAAWLSAPVMTRSDRRRSGRGRSKPQQDENEGSEHDEDQSASDDGSTGDTAAALVDLAIWLDKAGYPDEYATSGRTAAPPQHVSERV